MLGQLATGGMAEILLARLSGPAAFARAVVIKRMLRQHAQKRAFVTMFLDEARTIAKIRHPNVVQVQELGEDAGEIFLVLEYVAGENLSSILKRSVAVGERLEPMLVAHVIAEACAGLHAAHELVSDDGRHQNLVHRDVSPQNLFVAYDGHVKLLDFGVAITDERVARTEVGDVKGKLEYMSPEQARAEPLDRRSDIFAMGIVLYELGTGRRLFKRLMPARTLEAICSEPVIPPSRVADDFPPALETVVMKALAKNPAERYATAAEMRAALLDVARGMTQPVEALAERMKRWFPERIAEKSEMLRRLAGGDAVSDIPAGEVDDDVVVPSMPAAAPVVTRRRPPWAAIAIGLLAVTAIALGAAKLGARSAASANVDAATSSLGANGAISDVPSASEPPAPSDVLVRVESRPPGARVLTDGDDRGTTPLDLRLARGATSVRVELRLAGFTSTTQVVVPDADQKLVLSLAPAGRRSAPRPGPTGAASGFRRFD